MKDFQKNRQSIYDAIYDVVRTIPKGRVTSFGAIAAAIGTRSGARVVGYALRHCPAVRPKVPAHRVVNSSGLLTGRHQFDPPEKMQQLLEKEGVEIRDHKVVRFQELFWDPIKEIGF